MIVPWLTETCQVLNRVLQKQMTCVFYGKANLYLTQAVCKQEHSSEINIAVCCDMASSL
jgi:hypothetical protein